MKKLAFLNLISLFLSAETLPTPYRSTNKSPVRKDPVLKKPVKKIIPKGLKEFYYGDKIIYALNQKNADRKFKKLLST